MPEIPPEALIDAARPRAAASQNQAIPMGAPTPTSTSGRAPIPASSVGNPPATAIPAPLPSRTPISAMNAPKLTGQQWIIDDVVRHVAKQKEIALDELAKLAGWKVADLETVLKLLENQSIVRLNYPASLLQGPRVSVVKVLDDSILPLPPGEVLEKYHFIADDVEADVQIVLTPDDNRPFFALFVQTFGPYTQVILEELRDKVAASIQVDAVDLTDVEQARGLQVQFVAAAKQQLGNTFKGSSASNLSALVGHMLHSLYGLGELEMLMADNNLEEVAINSSKTPVTVYHRKYGWMKTNLLMSGEEQIQNLSAQIARKNGREITNLHPILDAHLLSGDRVNATLFPISSSGNTLTIRRFARKPWTIIDFIGKENTMSVEMAAWLWIAMQYELSIMVAGSTASGKTSALNAMCAFIPSHQRVITIEDVRELNLPEYMQWNWVPLTTRNPNPEGAGEVTMLDLLISSLRMRPDRLIVGEMRSRQEAETLFEAVHTGHSVYSTIHAESARQVLRRLTEPPIEIPALEVESLDLILVQYRDRKLNVRRTLEIAELEASSQNEQLEVNIIFRWAARGDTFEKLAEPRRLIQKLNLHTGMTEMEIQNEVLDRILILEWMKRHEYSSIHQVGVTMREFNADPQKVKNAARTDVDPHTYFEGNTLG